MSRDLSKRSYKSEYFVPGQMQKIQSVYSKMNGSESQTETKREESSRERNMQAKIEKFVKKIAMRKTRRRSIFQSEAVVQEHNI